MKKFIRNILIFNTPLIIIFLIPAIYLKMTGENFAPIDDIIKNKDSYLIGYAFNEENYTYLKEKELESRNSLSIVALGSSRILQFRDFMFDSSFYNAGYTVSRISDFIPFIKSNLKNKHPKVLLIALDQWMFNEKWDNLSDYSPTKKHFKTVFNTNASGKDLLSVWPDILKGKFGPNSLTQYDNLNKIGLNAVINNTGFRKDGSIYNGGQIHKLLDSTDSTNEVIFLDTYSRIETGNRYFEYGNQVNKTALVVLNDLLKYCKKNNIYVVGILPPFADKVNFRLQQSGKYTYMNQIFPKSNKLFKNQGFELWDMTNLNKFNSNDQEILDGFHSSEVTYLKMLIYMIENGSKLNDYTTLERLKNDLSNKQNNYAVYKY